MNNLTAIVTISVFITIILFLIVKITKQKQKIAVLEERVEQASKITKAYADSQKEMASIIKKEKEQGQITLEKVAEASKSEEPEKKSIAVSNDIVNSFNRV